MEKWVFFLLVLSLFCVLCVQGMWHPPGKWQIRDKEMRLDLDKGNPAYKARYNVNNSGFSASSSITKLIKNHANGQSVKVEAPAEWNVVTRKGLFQMDNVTLNGTYAEFSVNVTTFGINQFGYRPTMFNQMWLVEGAPGKHVEPFSLPYPSFYPIQFENASGDKYNVPMYLGNFSNLLIRTVAYDMPISSNATFSLQTFAETSVGPLKIAYSRYDSSNGYKEVNLEGGYYTFNLHLPENATMVCNNETRTIYLDIHVVVESIIDPSSDIYFEFPSFDQAFGQGVVCERSAIIYTAYITLSDGTDPTSWVIVIAVIVGAVLLICVLCCLLGATWFVYHKYGDRWCGEVDQATREAQRRIEEFNEKRRSRFH